MLDTAELSKATCCSIHGLNNAIVVSEIVSIDDDSETVALLIATIDEKRQKLSKWAKRRHSSAKGSDDDPEGK